jgi:hypothetical protein
MTNSRMGVTVTLERWINNPGIKKGILSIYLGEPFDYTDNRASYEIGRQVGVLARSNGLTTRGSILRKKPNSEEMAIVKTKLPILQSIVYYQLDFKPSQLTAEIY